MAFKLSDITTPGGNFFVIGTAGRRSLIHTGDALTLYATCMAMGAPTKLMKSTDRGATWSQVASFGIDQQTGLSLMLDSQGFPASSGGMVVRGQNASNPLNNGIWIWPTTPAGAPTFESLVTVPSGYEHESSVTSRTGGEVIALGRGTPSTSMGNSYEQVGYYRRLSNGTWNPVVNISAGGANNYEPYAVLQSGPHIAFFYYNYTSYGFSMKVLSGFDNTLSTNNLLGGSGAAFATGSGTSMILGHMTAGVNNGITSDVHYLLQSSATSVSHCTWDGSTNAVQTVVDTFAVSSSARLRMALTVDTTDNKLYVVYSYENNPNVYMRSKTIGGAWSAESIIYTETNGTYCQVYDVVVSRKPDNSRSLLIMASRGGTGFTAYYQLLEHPVYVVSTTKSGTATGGYALAAGATTGKRAPRATATGTHAYDRGTTTGTKPLRGSTTGAVDFAGTAAGQQPVTSAIFSDDFEDGTLDARWIEADPNNIATWTESGGTLTISTTTGGDAWQGPAANSRMLQTHNDTDFDIAAKWTVPNNTGNEGVGVWADDGTDNEYLRADVRNASNNAATFASDYVNGTYTVRDNTTLGALTTLFPNGYIWVRMRRVGAVITCYYRDVDGGSWTQFVSWTTAVNVNRVGLSYIHPNLGSESAYEFTNLLAATAPTGTAAGSADWAGSAAGSTPAVPVPTGSTTGTYTLAGSTASVRTPKAETTGGYAYAGTAQGEAPLAGLTGLTAVAVSAAQIDVSWDAYPGALGYDIERDGVVIITDHQSASYSDTGLAEATTYSYRVRARI